VNEQIKALSEGVLAGLTVVNQGGDLIADKGIRSARRAAQEMGVNNLAAFGATEGGHSRYDTGSHVDVDSLTVLAGVAKGFDFNPAALTLGIFVEGGWGSYNSYNSFNSAAAVSGNGDTSFVGGGILGRFDFCPTGPGHFYAEGSGRIGQVKTDFFSGDFMGGASGYDDVSSLYYGLHLGAGYVFNLSEQAELDVYARYLLTHQNSDDVVLYTGDRIEFDSVNSSRARVGARLGYAISDLVKPYVGAAYEYEFDGKADASTNGFAIDAPELTGSTGMGELGLSFKPYGDSGALSLDLGVQGFVGERQGVLGSLQIKFEF
jgi:outer membrane autotransporter protein